LKAAEETEHIEAEPAPFVPQTSLNDFCVSYELNAYTDRPKLIAKVYSDLHQNIQDKFNEAGVEIMSPHFSAVRDGNRINVPESYVPEDYVAPAFRIVGLESGAPNP
jgi:small-conductance mechanosensitive channel